jgi:hypothetical protein
MLKEGVDGCGGRVGISTCDTAVIGLAAGGLIADAAGLGSGLGRGGEGWAEPETTIGMD